MAVDIHGMCILENNCVKNINKAWSDICFFSILSKGYTQDVYIGTFKLHKFTKYESVPLLCIVVLFKN